MYKILLAEDNRQIRTLLRLLLTRSGYEVWEACNGKEVNDLYQQHRPDLLITDLLMPEKDGLEVIMELRHNNQTLRIIAMSGGGHGKAESYLQIAQKLGADRILSKPFSNEDFLTAVRLTLEPDG